MRKRSTRAFGYEREQARRRAEGQRKARELLASDEIVPSAPALSLGPTTPARVTSSEADSSPRTGAEGPAGRRHAGQALECGWCGGTITLRRTGRLPRWCSATCRQRAWEQKRAAASGRAALQIVDRCVVVEPGDQSEWVALLITLTTQLRRGSVWGTAIAIALLDALEALEEQERRRDADRRW